MRGRRPALIPGQGAAQGIGQGQDASGESVGDQIGAFALGQRDQQQEPGRASDQGDDRGHAFAEEQIALPVTRDCPVNAPPGLFGAVAVAARAGGRIVHMTSLDWIRIDAPAARRGAARASISTRVPSSPRLPSSSARARASMRVRVRTVRSARITTAGVTLPPTRCMVARPFAAKIAARIPASGVS